MRMVSIGPSLDICSQSYSTRNRGFEVGIVNNSSSPSTLKLRILTANTIPEMERAPPANSEGSAFNVETPSPHPHRSRFNLLPSHKRSSITREKNLQHGQSR